MSSLNPFQKENNPFAKSFQPIQIRKENELLKVVKEKLSPLYSSLKNKILDFINKTLSPKEIILVFLALFISLLGIITIIYKGIEYFESERIVYTGEISEGIVGTPKVANPLFAKNQVDKDLGKLIYSPLIENVDGDKFDLVLAEKVETSLDRQTYKITISQNAYFQDDKPVTSDDVIYSLETVYIDRDFNLEKIDDKHFNLKLKKPSQENIFEKLTVPVVAKDENTDAPFTVNLSGSGYFKVKSIDKDSEGNITDMTLIRFANGSSKLPFIKTYKINFYKNEQDAYSAFQNHSIDVLGGIPGGMISKIKDDTSATFETPVLPNNVAVFINQSENPVLQDEGFRHALSDSIDRSALVNQVLGGFGVPESKIAPDNKDNGGKAKSTQEIITDLTNGKGSSFLYENGVLYISTNKKATSANGSKDNKNSSSTNPKASNSISNSKEQVVIKITTIDNKEILDTVNFLANSWKKIGVETTIQTIDRKNLANVVKDRDFEILLYGFSVKSPKDYYSFFHSKERTYPKLNISNFANKNVDKILEQLQNTSDKDTQDDLVSQLSDEIENNVPVIILYKPQYIIASHLKSRILLPDFLSNEENRYNHVKDWYTKTEMVFSFWKNISFIDKLDIFLN